MSAGACLSCPHPACALQRSCDLPMPPPPIPYPPADASGRPLEAEDQRAHGGSRPRAARRNSCGRGHTSSKATVARAAMALLGACSTCLTPPAPSAHRARRCPAGAQRRSLGISLRWSRAQGVCLPSAPPCGASTWQLLLRPPRFPVAPSRATPSWPSAFLLTCFHCLLIRASNRSKTNLADVVMTPEALAALVAAQNAASKVGVRATANERLSLAAYFESRLICRGKNPTTRCRRLRSAHRPISDHPPPPAPSAPSTASECDSGRLPPRC